MSIVLPAIDRDRSSSYISMSSLSDFRDVGVSHISKTDRPAIVRRNIYSSVYEHRYNNILDQRMGHIPLPLPFPRDALILKLKEGDRESPDWNNNSKLFELDTECVMLSHELETPIDRKKKGKERLRQRLLKIWDLLTVQEKRLKLVSGQRLGRLRFNTKLFLQSDFPSLYLAVLGESTYWELAALNLALDVEGQQLVSSILGRSIDKVSKDVFMDNNTPLQKIDTAYRKYHRNLGLVTPLADIVLEWRDAVEYYVDLYSARDLSQFRIIRPIKMEQLDYSVLRQLNEGLLEATKTIREKLIAQYRNELWRVQWSPPDDPYIAGLIQLELETT